MSFKPHWCDQNLCLWNADIDVQTPLIPLHWIFQPSHRGEAGDTGTAAQDLRDDVDLLEEDMSWIGTSL